MAENSNYIKITSKRYNLYKKLRNIFHKHIFSLWRKQNFPWFDHRLDELNWPNNLFWVERGVFGRKYINEGDKVLDLCCGDAYFSKYFYSTIQNVHIDAVDIDHNVLALAKSFEAKENIDFSILDIVKDDFPLPKYDVILWFEAIEHITKEDCKIVFGKINSSLREGGILFGSTPIVDEIGGHNWQHCNEFTNLDSLKNFLEHSFNNVETWASIYPEGRSKRNVGYFLVTSSKKVSQLNGLKNDS